MGIEETALLEYDDQAQERLRATERQGLKLAVLCRTLVVGVAAGWYTLAPLALGDMPNLIAMASMLAFFIVGVLFYLIIGTRWDRPILKYAFFSADMLGAFALISTLPLNETGEVPQILVFRAYGIYYLFPLVALSTLALSWRLVIWTGLAAVLAWWSAFGVIVSGMATRLSWQDLPVDSSASAYQALLLAPEFIGVGNRVEETLALLIGALILALTVYRARQVFFAQIAAEAERSYISEAFGQYVPGYLVSRLLHDPTALAPQVRRATVLSVDIAGFTSFVEQSSPEGTIRMLDAFFAESADIIAQSDGLIVDFSGDGFLASFNAPLPIDHQEQRALEAANALLERVSNQRFDGQKLSIRIGIATGEIAAGSVGGGGRRGYTIHGDTVNLAARLQDLAKTKGLVLLMDGDTASKVAPEQVAKVEAEASIRGRQSTVALFTSAG